MIRREIILTPEGIQKDLGMCVCGAVMFGCEFLVPEEGQLRIE
jgi:hypothetical protein